MKTSARSLACLASLLGLFSLPSLLADAVPSGLIADNAVFQQGMPVPVWGTAAEGESVTVSFAGQKLSTVARDGKWMVRLFPMPPSFEPQTLTISGATNTLSRTNILVGEVWICSGQSNMERELGLRKGQKPIVDWEKEAASADYPAIRHFTVPRRLSTNPVNEVTGNWAVCSPLTVTNFTAVGYFFGRDLYRDLHVPVGLIHSSWGGTPAEGWTREGALADDPALAPMLDSAAQARVDFPNRLARYQAEEPALKAAWETASAQAVAGGKKAPAPPKAPIQPDKDPHSPTLLFNGMIHPLIPYAFRGVIWYQGESNRDHPEIYNHLFSSMINDWRAQWGQGDFPFLYVQVAPYYQMTPEIREAQADTLSTAANTAMVVTTDCGDAKDIHPANKQPVGARLALAARAKAYGEGVEYSGPVFTKASFGGGIASVTFSHAGMGLSSGGDPLKGFTIAGEDKVFRPADAVIRGSEVIVSSPEVSKPVAVRYGWDNVPDCNLSNLAGLPASPFRSDRP